MNKLTVLIRCGGTDPPVEPIACGDRSERPAVAGLSPEAVPRSSSIRPRLRHGEESRLSWTQPRGAFGPGTGDSSCVTLRVVGASTYTVNALDEATWPAFAALVEANNGIFGGCWCMGFHPDGGDKNATAAGNRERKLSRVRTDTAHAALVFDEDDCVGWCQFGEPDEVSRIKSRAAYERDLVTLPDWRIGCCYVGKGHRRQGVFSAALAGALDLIAHRGGGTIEGYPEPADAVSAGFLYNGSLST